MLLWLLRLRDLKRELFEFGNILKKTPFEEAIKAFRSAYVFNMQTNHEGDREAIIDQSGLSEEIINSILSESGTE